MADRRVCVNDAATMHVRQDILPLPAAISNTTAALACKRHATPHPRSFIQRYMLPVCTCTCLPSAPSHSVVQCSVGSLLAASKPFDTCRHELPTGSCMRTPAALTRALCDICMFTTANTYTPRNRLDVRRTPSTRHRRFAISNRQVHCTMWALQASTATNSICESRWRKCDGTANMGPHAHVACRAARTWLLWTAHLLPRFP